MTDFMKRRDFLRRTGAGLALGAVVAAQVKASAQNSNEVKEEKPSVAAPSEKKAAWKKAVKYSMLPKDASLEDNLKLVKAVGFDAVEYDLPLGTPEEAAKMQELAKSLGTYIHGIVFGGWHAPLSDPDEAVRKKGIMEMANAIRCARAIGTDTVLLVPAVVNDKVGYQDAWDRSQSAIRELLPIAEKEKVHICIENVWNKFLLSPIEFAKYVDDFNSPWVRAYFDVGNCILFGYAEDWAKTLGKRIQKVDIKDFKRKGYEWCNLGDGDVNFEAVKKELRAIGFNSYMTAELKRQDEAGLRDIVQRMDNLLS